MGPNGTRVSWETDLIDITAADAIRAASRYWRTRISQQQVLLDESRTATEAAAAVYEYTRQASQFEGAAAAGASAP